MILAGVAGGTWWRAAHVLTEATAQTKASTSLPFTLLPVRMPVGRFEPMTAQADFRAAALFEGSLFVSGANGLGQFDSAGRQMKVWRTGIELPATTLTALAVRKGVGTPELWIGTASEGVLVLSGSVMRQLLPESQSLRTVSALLGLTSGRILIGEPEAGLFVSDGQKLNLLHPQFRGMQVTALAGDEDSLWVGTRAEGAWHWQGGQVVQYKTELPDAQVLSLATAGQGAWVGTPVGIAEFVDGRFERKLGAALFAQAMSFWRETLLVGTVDQGVATIQLGKARTSPPVNIGDKALGSFLVTGTDVLGIGKDRVVSIGSGEVIVGPEVNALAALHITALHVDDLDHLWVGYFDRGLDITSIASAAPPRHLENDHLFCINRVKASRDRKVVAVATANGLLLFDETGGLHQTLTRSNGLIADQVTDVLFEGGGADLVAATPAGLTFVHAGVASSLYAFQGLVNNHVYTLAEFQQAGARELLAGTLGGFSLLKERTVQASFTTANSDLQQNWITASSEAWGSLYLGTYGSGVVRLTETEDLQTFPEFGKREGRLEINPNAMMATAQALYAGTAGRGLAVLGKNSDRWEFITAGLPSLNVTALANAKGVLYVGTDNGLVRTREAL